ncbi:Dehydrogenase [Massilia sp. 9I]|nr:Dehydrogenase [Massilia sp. 9I]
MRWRPATPRARAAGHQVELVEAARLGLPLLTSQDAWQHGTPPPGVAAVQEAIHKAQHLVFFYPLWLGDMPALLKGFLEQVARPGFALDPAPRNPLRAGLLGGRSARLVVSMGMPALLYRWFYGAPSLRLMRRNILGFAGIEPVRSTIVGSTGALDAAAAERLFARMRRLGVQAR